MFVAAKPLLDTRQLAQQKPSHMTRCETKTCTYVHARIFCTADHLIIQNSLPQICVMQVECATGIVCTMS